jgi:hypothetical protein
MDKLEKRNLLGTDIKSPSDDLWIRSASDRSMFTQELSTLKAHRCAVVNHRLGGQGHVMSAILLDGRNDCGPWVWYPRGGGEGYWELSHFPVTYRIYND